VGDRGVGPRRIHPETQPSVERSQRKVAACKCHGGHFQCLTGRGVHAIHGGCSTTPQQVGASPRTAPASCRGYAGGDHGKTRTGIARRAPVSETGNHACNRYRGLGMVVHRYRHSVVGRLLRPGSPYTEYRRHGAVLAGDSLVGRPCTLRPRCEPRRVRAKRGVRPGDLILGDRLGNDSDQRGQNTRNLFPPLFMALVDGLMENRRFTFGRLFSM
jgi:hypothetical protein